MYSFLTKRGQLLALLLGIVCILIAIFSIIGGLSGAGYSSSDDLNQIMKASEEPMEFPYFNAAVYIPIILIVAVVVIWIGFSIMSLIDHPRGSLKFLLGFGAVLVLFFIFFSLSDAEHSGQIGYLVQSFDVSDTASKVISGGIKTAIFAIGTGLIAAVAFEIYNLFK